MGFFSDSRNIPSQHRQQFVDFRVVLYRLEFRSTFRLDNRDDLSFDVIFNTDFGDPLYDDISVRLNNEGSFLSFLKKYYDASLEEITQRGTRLLEDNIVFREIDITPLINTVNIHLDLMPSNRCQLNMMDPVLSDLSNIELARFGPVNQVSTTAGSKDNKDRLTELRDVRMREFDLIRVFASAPVEQNANDKATVLKKQVISRIVDDELVDRFVMLPVFTGLVSDVTRSNTVGQPASLTVGCLGMQRMFMQSVTINNDSLANVVRDATPELTALKDKFSAFNQRFADGKTDEILQEIFKDYLHPKFVRDAATGAMTMGLPDISGLFDAALPPATVVSTAPTLLPSVIPPTEFRSIPDPNLIPMFPTVLLFHMLKKKYGEPMLRIDDRVDGSTARARKISRYPFSNNINFDGRKDALLTALDPYLIRFRSAFSFFSASYQSAEDVFNSIRQATFLEFFEDRTGEFHLRFPRYNNPSIRTIIDAKDVISIDFNKSDSAIYSVEEAQIKLPVTASGSLIPPQVFVDKFSIFKFGFRRPQTIENPNAFKTSESSNFAKKLAEFSRSYYSLKSARTATVRKIGDPTINVGDMVFFRLQADAKRDTIEVPGIAYEQEFVGYVLSIDEQIQIGGEYTQQLNLGFARPVEVNEPIQANVPRSSVGTIWDAVTTGALKIDAGRKLTRSVLNSSPSGSRATEPFIHEIASGGFEIDVEMREFLDPLDLAFASAQSEEIQNMLRLQALHNRKDIKADPKELAKAKVSLEVSIDLEKLVLSVIALRNAILSGFRSGGAQSRRDGGFVVRNLKDARKAVEDAKTKRDLYEVANSLEAKLRAERAKFTSRNGLEKSRAVLEPFTFTVGKNTVSLADTTQGTPPLLNSRIRGAILGWSTLLGAVQRHSVGVFNVTFLRPWRDLFSINSSDPLSPADKKIALKQIASFDDAIERFESDGLAALEDISRISKAFEEIDKIEKDIAAAKAAKRKEGPEAITANERPAAVPPEAAGPQFIGP